MNIGRYEIQQELGRGGMATVYHAYDPRFRREVAVKVLPRELLHNPQFRARFEREAQTIATLEHPAIVPVYDFGEEDGQLYLVMRLMSGGSLADRLRERGALPLSETVEIIERLAPALDVAHKRGIIHRDLKPGNILFDQYDNACLSDFGIVKLTEEATALSGSGIIGTPAYMSPEQISAEGALDGRSDLYALGVMLYEMLTGRFPFQADTPMRLAMKHLTEPVPRLTDARPDLPRTLNAVIERAMAKTPDQRYATIGELAAGLRAAAAQFAEAPVHIAGRAGSAQYADDPMTLPSHLPAASTTYDAESSPHSSETTLDEPHSAPRPERKPLPLMQIGIGALVVILVGAALMFGPGFLPSGQSTPTRQPTDDSESGTLPTETAMPAGVATDVPDEPTQTAEPTVESTADLPDNRITADNAAQLTALHTVELGQYIQSLDWQPDTSILSVGISQGSNGSTVLFDPAAGEELHRFSGTGATMAWSPDGALLGTSTGSGQVTIWDASTYEPLRAFTPNGHFGDWSADGLKFAFDAETSGAVQIWDAETDTEIAFFEAIYASEVVWSPTEERLVAAGQGLFLWETGGDLVLQPNAISAPAYCAAWSPDGKRLAMGLSTGLVTIWDVKLNARITEVDLSDEGVQDVDWSSDGTLIAASTYEGLIYVLDVKSGTTLFQTPDLSYGWAVAISPDMRWLATGTGLEEGTLTIWRIAP